MTEVLARLRGISKRYGSLPALNEASLTANAGEVHGVLGENGAGKSTLLRVLGGLVRPDAGEVCVAGTVRAMRSPRDAWDAGVGMVHQHFTLVPNLSVLENLALGRRTSARGLRLPLPELRSEAGALMERTGLVVPLEAPAGTLGVGSRQRVEILKALLRHPRILVLDEPTAVLTPQEVDALFLLLREIAEEGRAVILVAHKLDEVLAVADTVTVLRRGRTVLSMPRAGTDVPGLIQAMVGEGEADAAAVGHVGDGSPALPAEHGSAPRRVAAELEEVRVRGERGEWAVDGATLAAARGEIVGIAGVEGNGQRELALVLAGRLAPAQGRVRIPESVAFVPQDRNREGLVGSFDLASNVALALHGVAGFRKGPFLRWGALRERTEELLRRFDVRTPDARATASTLSGGNQQRLLLARELSLAAELVVAENPTRGLDVGAAAFVHRELRALVATPGGPAVVLLSTDLDEVLALAHRVFVMVRGRLVAVPEGERTRQRVGAYMLAGVRA